MGKIIRIIIEGPDCSAKSTLVERVKNTLRWDSRYLRHKEADQFERYLLEYASANQVVFDRGHFSESVYSKLWRGGSPFSKKQKEILNKICCEKTLLIFACPSVKNIKSRYLSRNYGQQIKVEELELSRILFIEEFRSLTKIIYKSEDYDELENLLVKVKQIVEEE